MSERPTNPGAATSIGEITRLIAESSGGSDAARDRLTSILYAELHGMARSRMRGERPDHTLGATGLVNETYLRLFRSTGADHGDAGLPWRDRRAFFAAAATAMRRILIDHARAKKSDKRGGKRLKEGARIEADAVAAAESLDPSDYIALDEAIDRLEQI
ncbi:MAG: ECF-type sigma factor, partial [Planctomycetota bacterium]